jgi:hypothetical protein
VTGRPWGSRLRHGLRFRISMQMLHK